jgi:hypothetical protein
MMYCFIFMLSDFRKFTEQKIYKIIFTKFYIWFIFLFHFIFCSVICYHFFFFTKQYFFYVQQRKYSVQIYEYIEKLVMSRVSS